ncbi:hypothetical protein EYF80_040928 [Liparis tanakae]|uniref:Uncharacterized protein n=1 Tax=Liparis tanakae TaxID=230148 RepID=A0A4Z2G8D6_9TELE|nr:hypothetical protein EYF80_040928 [Liparis tanakae]
MIHIALQQAMCAAGVQQVCSRCACRCWRYLLRLRSGQKMSFPGWSTDLHIRPIISTSSQQHSSRCTWSRRLSSTNPEGEDQLIMCTSSLSARLVSDIMTLASVSGLLMSFMR